jgi:large subunit ribosomal protein L6
MSKIGKKPIVIPDDVKIEISDNKIIIEGPKGKLEKNFPSEINIDKKEKELLVSFRGPKEKKALWGSWWAHIVNMIKGVKNGFEKSLKIEGVGWRVKLEGKTLVLKLGFSHSIKIPSPEGVDFLIEKDIIKILGIDKDKVGNVAAKIRAIYPPEPYKGKGIRYVDEVVRKKAGKKAVATIK